MAAASRTVDHTFRLNVQHASRHRPLPCRRTLRRWVGAALQREAQVTLRFIDSAEGRRLNRQYRARDYATNVLTFTYPELRPLQGDIVLCVPVAKREAAERGIAHYRHLAHLIVHGILHLQGYDHEREADATKMESRETRIMRALGYADPYVL